MKIKRYQADDMRSAIRKVREELGADAVILSNQKINKLTEIVAAIDYDESLFNDMYPALGEKEVVNTSRHSIEDDLRYTRNVIQQETNTTPPVANNVLNNTTQALADLPVMSDMQKELKELKNLLVNQLSGLAWRDELKAHPLRARILQRLIALGISPCLAKKIANEADKSADFEHNWRHALALLSHRITVTNDDILSNGGVIALIGSTGVGKTTTVAKLAAQYILRHGNGSIALISTDNYRIAAHEQLRTFSRILNVPMYVSSDIEQLKNVIHSLRDKALVLIDTAGLSQEDLIFCEKFSLFRNENKIKTYLVHAANAQRSVIEDITIACSNVDICGCILTKVDETTSLGGALSVNVEHNIPVAYLSNGQRIPEDLHIAYAHSLVSKSVAIMQDVAKLRKNKHTSQSVSGMVAYAHG